MICKNCGHENLEGANFCVRCGISFFEVNFKIYWYSIIAGVIFGIFALHILYAVIGTKHVFTFGMIPIIMVSSVITGLLAYNRNLQAVYDFNAVINSGMTGMILGVSMILYLLSII